MRRDTKRLHADGPEQETTVLHQCHALTTEPPLSFGTTARHRVITRDSDRKPERRGNAAAGQLSRKARADLQAYVTVIHTTTR